MEYITAEILELSGNACKDNKNEIISPRHINLSVQWDDELRLLLKDVIVIQGGVMPNIALCLLPKLQN